jgi:hypothetical protein
MDNKMESMKKEEIKLERERNKHLSSISKSLDKAFGDKPLDIPKFHKELPLTDDDKTRILLVMGFFNA